MQNETYNHKNEYKIYLISWMKTRNIQFVMARIVEEWSGVVCGAWSNIVSIKLFIDIMLFSTWRICPHVVHCCQRCSKDKEDPSIATKYRTEPEACKHDRSSATETASASVSGVLLVAAKPTQHPLSPIYGRSPDGTASWTSWKNSDIHRQPRPPFPSVRRVQLHAAASPCDVRARK